MCCYIAVLDVLSHVAFLAANMNQIVQNNFSPVPDILVQPCANPFLPVYLARFFHAATIGLKYSEQVM